MANTLVPHYETPTGIGLRGQYAHANSHIQKLNRHIAKHQATIEKLESARHQAVDGVKIALPAIATSAASLSTASVLGYVNGRYGSSKGYVTKFGMPADLLTGIVFHTAALVATYHEVQQRKEERQGPQSPEQKREQEHREQNLQNVLRVIHGMGDAGLGVSAYRWCFVHGAHAAATAVAQTNHAPIQQARA